MSTDEMLIDEILVGERDRQDLGNVDELAASIAEVGLLHPVVITVDGELVAGDRRLAACKSLDWEMVPVTVVDLDSAEAILKAEADENTCRKALTPYEASRARERRAKLLAPKAAENKGGRPKKAEDETSGKLPEVSSPPRAERETRHVASVGTGYSPRTLDKVDKIRDVAERGVIKRGKEEVPAPQPVRDIAVKALSDVKKTGAAVDRSSKDLTEAIDTYVGADPDVQRAKLAKSFVQARGKALDITLFSAEHVAAVIEPDQWRDMEREAAAVADWWKSLFAHRTGGLRIVGGTGV